MGRKLFQGTENKGKKMFKGCETRGMKQQLNLQQLNLFESTVES
jgi:hypothetical protein